MTDEQWRPIPGYEGAYEVSDLGRVRSLDRWVPRGNGQMLWRGRVLKATIDGNGRRSVNLHRGEGGRTHLVYRLVMETFVGPCPDGMEVCHGDGVKTNDVLANLRYDTRGNNNLDAVRHGTHWGAAKTHCPQGHPYDEENTYIPPSAPTTRRCRACQRVREARWRKANRSTGSGKPTAAA